jgi:hypothetical protein
MGLLSKLFGRSQDTSVQQLFGKPSVPLVQQIVETLLPMRIMNRTNWDDIRQWLCSALAHMAPNEAHQLWLEIQEKCRVALCLAFFDLAMDNGLTQEAATDFAGKWTVLMNFWFTDVDRPVDKTNHLLKLDREPDGQLMAEIERQDPRVIPHLKEMRKNDPEIGWYLMTLRRMQIDGTPTNEPESCVKASP